MKSVLNSVVSSIRAFASRLISRSDSSSKEIVEVVASTTRNAIPVLDLYRQVVESAAASLQAYDSVMQNPVVRPMIERLAKNVINDFATRTNELANIVEAAGKEPDVVAAFAKLAVTVERVSEAVERARSAQKSQHMYVVRDDDASSSKHDN